ncbi:hypothetical protein FBF48_10415 [Streptococcus salivarius]|uniref:Uncharacterized protein n=1 Tax=Streptococcus salivarius TaxID=1304 RepID=A0AAX2UZM8_STRSL|nr:hypothetical protein [Streptococcus salivarius]TNF65638.1 hypothetical protein FBF48_10415 [Streptococcus salivarius]
MSTIQALIDGKPHGFEIRRLPPNKRIKTVCAIRDTVSGMVLLLGENGCIYSDQVTQGRSWSWQQRVSSRVVSALVGLGVITQAQADDHNEACKLRRDIEQAYWNVESLRQAAETCGATVSGGEKYEHLCKLAALYVKD